MHVILLAVYLCVWLQGALQVDGLSEHRFWRLPGSLLKAVTSATTSPWEASKATLLDEPPPGPYNSSCGPVCNKHGVCNEEIARCDCPRHRDSPACATQAADLTATCQRYGLSRKQCFDKDVTGCLNQCNQRGRCIAGYCHCRPGHWGSDCALSMGPDGRPVLLAGQGYAPRQRRPRIYVYELPPALNLWRSTTRLDRPLFLLFWQQLLSAGVRTADGEAADYYFMPVRLRMGGEDSARAVEAVQYVRQTWPWWDRHGGARHIFIQTGDMGRIESEASLLNLTRQSIWLTHWGLHTNHDYAQWPASHRPGLDIVVPVFVQPSLVRSYGMYRSPLHPDAPRRHQDRHKTLFFAGRICENRQAPVEGVWPNCGDPMDPYSAGVRQRVHYHHWNRSGYKIVVSSKTYADDMAAHKFCLAPTGGGHGKRNVLVSLMGCLPVVVTDGVYQPFEPEIDWSKFSVGIKEADIPTMHDVLDALTPKQIQEYQRRLYCGAQHLFWSTTHGGIIGESGAYDAFNTVLEILRVRLSHPGVPPEQYAAVDDEFRRFMDCELHGPPPPGKQGLCSYSEVGRPALPCSECRRKMSQNFLMPGGAICCHKLRLAHCPRLWP